VSLPRGMDAVRLIQLRNRRHTLEEKGDQGRVVARGQLRESRPKRVRETYAKIRRRFHSGDDHPGIGMCGSRPIHDLLEIRPHGLNAEPGESARGCLAAHAGVEDPERVPGGIQFGLDESGESLVNRKSVTRGETGAQEQDDGPAVILLQRRARGR
jgi:hypothetical protein